MIEEQTSTNAQPKQSKPKPRNWGSLGIFFFVLGFMVIIITLSYGYFALSHINMTLANIISNLETRFTLNKNQMNDLQYRVTELQEGMQKAQDFSQQQEKLITEWKQSQQGNTDKWRIAQAQHLTKLAQDYLQFSHNVPLALILVKQANSQLENLSDTQLLEIRKSLTTDISNLQAIPVVDTTAIFLKLVALNNQLDHLPLPKSLIPDDNAKVTTTTTPPSTWKRGLDYTWQVLSKIVIIRKNNEKELPLFFPEEKEFLYQNLHAQLENATWGLLHENSTVYQTSLMQINMWIKKYFVQDAQETKLVLQNLTDLQNIKINVPNYNLATTLQRFDQFFVQGKT